MGYEVESHLSKLPKKILMFLVAHALKTDWIIFLLWLEKIIVIRRQQGVLGQKCMESIIEVVQNLVKIVFLKSFVMLMLFISFLKNL